MKENKELERSDIVIDRDLQLDDDNPSVINAYLETWFDVDRNFGTHTADRDDEWLNLYANFNATDGALKMTCCVSNDDESHSFDYEPSAAESALIKAMITEKIREEYGQTPQKFCTEHGREEQMMGGLQ